MKVMLPEVVSDPGLRARFKLEATVTAEIESEHIVETFDAGVDAETGAPFLVMELLRGRDLDEELEKRGRLSASEVVTYLGQAALALDKTHAAGIVHRDLKPDNLFLTTRDDGSPRLKILDFGIAKVVQTLRPGVTTQVIGTPIYMSPEQIRGADLGPRADLYALGQIAYTLLVGHSYWRLDADDTTQLFRNILAGTTEPASVRAAARGVVLPAAFDAWFAKATATSRDERFPAAGGMISALAASLGLEPPRVTGAVRVVPSTKAATVEAHTAPTVTASALVAPTEPLSPPRPPQRFALALLIVSAIAVVGGGSALFVLRGSGARGGERAIPEPAAPTSSMAPNAVATPPPATPPEPVVSADSPAPSATPPPRETPRTGRLPVRATTRPAEPAATAPVDPTRMR
jgi:serine/threonine-protein kinase